MSNIYPDDPRDAIPGVDPGPYTFMKGGFIAHQHCAGDPWEMGQSLKKMRSFLGANDIIVPQTMGIPIKFSETPVRLRMPAFEHGQHTEEVLMELLGYSWEEISKLRDEGVI